MYFFTFNRQWADCVNGCWPSLSHVFLHSQQTIAAYVHGCRLSLNHVFLHSQQTMDASVNGCRLSLSYAFSSTACLMIHLLVGTQVSQSRSLLGREYFRLDVRTAADKNKYIKLCNTGCGLL